ncbi:MAG: hypothetical protein R3D60_14040 [Paracoccaceae bacterium]
MSNSTLPSHPIGPRIAMRLGLRALLLLSGGAVLGVVALVVPAVLPPMPPLETPQPSVWLSDLPAPRPVPFAEPGNDGVVIMPRVASNQPLPPVTTEVARVPAAATPPRPLPEGAPAAGPVIAQTTPPAIAGSPDAVPARTPDAVAVVAERAPLRSPRPPARPVAQVAALAPTPEAAPETIVLARSIAPQARPETVSRLAVAEIAPTTPDIAATPERRSFTLPALNERIARSTDCSPQLSRAIPRRAGRATGGEAVVARLSSAAGRERDAAVLAELLAGNIPDFMRDLQPVNFVGTAANGQPMTVTICVMPDYLAVGSDRDFVRVPLGLPAAMQVAERFEMVLPTTRMVDAIYTQASVRLSPAPMEPGAQMSTTGYFRRHNATVESQRSSSGARLGQLVAGHKKDLVLTNRLESNPGRVAIYGWHRRNGAPIQPLSTVHGAQYADYSHGIRLVSRTAFVNGQPIDLRDLLSDRRYAGLVSAEGTISNRRLLAALE